MKDSWKGKNIDLSVLSDRIIRFFTSKGFQVSLKKIGDNYSIVVTPQRYHEISEKIYVNISGRTDDFSIEFTAGTFSRSLILHAPVLSLIFGGYLALKALKSLEKIDMLEKEFWKYVDETIWYLESLK